MTTTMTHQDEVSKELADLQHRELGLNQEQRERYLAMRRSGQSHNIALMLAAQQPPMSNTDREFLEGHCNGNQFAGSLAARAAGDYYRRVAAAAGQGSAAGGGNVYLSGLAAYPGDPRAWVSSRGDVKRLLEERGWSARGSVEHNADPSVRGSAAPPTTTAIGTDIVLDAAEKALESGVLSREDAIEQAARLRAPHWANPTDVNKAAEEALKQADGWTEVI
jgi:hypothetical protein